MTINIELVYALSHTQSVIGLNVPENTTVAEAIALSGIAARHPEILEGEIVAGIFGRRVVLDTRLGAGDRIEIYRKLNADPKQARRKRALNARSGE